MSIRYTVFKDAGNRGNKTLAIRGLEEGEIVTVVEQGIVALKEDHIFLMEKNKPDGLNDEKIIFNKKFIDACSVCKHRVRRITEGCRYCQFESTKDEYASVECNPIDLVSYLKEKDAKEISVRFASTAYSPFEKRHWISDISLDDGVIEENKQVLSERAKKAAATRKFKKEHCSTCVYSNENNQCAHSHPNYCRLSYYHTEEEMMNKTLASIQRRDDLLRLSLICGMTIRVNRIRYRISYVANEVTEKFVLTRDYSPWDTTTVYLYELLKIDPSLKDMVDHKRLDHLTEEEKNRHAVTLHLIRKNWQNISRIEKWQNQHMFWSSLNLYNNQVDIAIHLSKDYYRYAYKTPLELVKKTIFIRV